MTLPHARSGAGWLLAGAALLVSAAPATSEPTGASLASQGDIHDRARALLDSDDAAAAAQLLAKHLQRTLHDPLGAELYGTALVALERTDEGAHWLAQAAAAYRDGRAARDLKRVEKRLNKADPKARLRSSRFEGLVRDLAKAAERLEDGGQPERALELYQRLLPFATGKAKAKIAAAVEHITSADAVVDLDASSSEPEAAEASGAWPLLTLETEHYVLACQLEPSVVEQLAITVEDVFTNFVGIYFDGKTARAPKRRVTIRIHGTWDEMASYYPGGTPSPGVQGWWSPGQAEIHAYDARTRGGSLDSTLLTLLHEGSHQFMSTFAQGGTPSWLNEGTACFFEGATVMADGRVLWPDAARGRLMALAADLSSKPRSGPRLREVLAYPGPGSYPGNYYHHGWGLAYFLQQWEHPETLEYAYRPLYIELLDRSTGRADQGLPIFEQIMLGKAAPLGHLDLDAFILDWERWILEQVLPLHSGPPAARRALRMQRAARYMTAADRAAAQRGKPPVSEQDLLLRALGDLEHVRVDLDGETVQRDVLERLAAVLERLGRKQTAAAMLEVMLDGADAGVLELNEEEYAGFERRLKTLDRSNFALRTVRARTRSHTTRMLALLDAYRDDHPDMVLRAYTLAVAATEALGDEGELRARANELRAEAKAKGRLLGRVLPLSGRRSDWKTVFAAEPREFAVKTSGIYISAVRPIGMIDTSTPIRGEYELRGVLERSDERHLGTAHGLVISGALDRDWALVGIDEDGHVGVWSVRNRDGSSARFKFVETLYLDQPVDPTAEPSLAVRVTPDGVVTVRVDGQPAVETKLDLEPGQATYAGVFARDGALRVRGLSVEIFQ
jgi:hypothetical protein